MAAKNLDSKSIYNLYIKKSFLTEEVGDEEVKQADSKDPEAKTSTPAPKDPYTGRSPEAVAEMEKAQTAGQQGDTTPVDQQAAVGASAKKAADEKEMGLLKQLHASDYNPNSTTDQKRLEELRTAQTKLKEKLGREPSLQELASVSYAQQYGEKSPYYAQAQKMGIDLRRPGQTTGAVVQPAQQQDQTATQSDQQQQDQTATQNDQQQPQDVWGAQTDQMNQSAATFINFYGNLTPQQKQWYKDNVLSKIE